MSTILKNKYLPYFLSFIGGILYAASFPIEFMISIPFASLVGVSLFFYSILNTTSMKTKFFHFLVFSLGAYALGYYWIPYTIKEFGNIYFPFNQILGIFFSLIIFPHFFIFIFLSNKIIKLKNVKKIRFIAYPLIALIITLIEHFTPTQFPTYLAHTFGFIAPYLGLTSIFGTIIFSFISFWLIISISIKPIIKREVIFPIIAFIILIICNLLSPISKYNSPEKEIKKLNIRMVQANIGNFLKKESESGDNLGSMTKVIERYKLMSLEDESGFKPDLIIWPETAYPRTFYSKYIFLDPVYIPEVFTEIVLRANAELFIGGYDFDRLDYHSYFETEYNAALLFTKDNTERVTLSNIYHKMILIPFGETLPFGPLNKTISKYVRNVSYFKKGSKYALFKTKNGANFISSICYEILQPGFTRTYLNKVNKEADFIINLTNDSWYGISSEPYQHLFLAKWRAYEFQIPIIRMTNTGISTIIYPDGSESKRSGLMKKENLDLEFKFSKRRKTMYQKYGYLPFAILFLVILIIVGITQFFIEKPSRIKS